MNEMNLNWDDLRLFLTVARNGGLASASGTGKSVPTLARRMRALEQALGQELFIRHARGYTLTSAGQDLLMRVTAAEAEIAPITQQSRPPVVKISAGAWVTHHLCRQVDRLQPDTTTTLRFLAADHVLDIRRRETVIGVRNQRPTQAGLAGQRVATVDFAIYAVAADVTTWAVVMGETPSARWVRNAVDGDAVIEVSHPRNALDLVLAGACKAVLPKFVASAYPALVPVSEPILALSHDQWLVSHDADRNLRPVRQVLDRSRDILVTADR